MGNLKGFQTRLSPEQKGEIQSLYVSGIPTEQIVEQFGCSKDYVSSIVRGLSAHRRQLRQEALLKHLRKLPEAKKGWIAGIIDGEGCIGFSRATGTDRLIPRVQVGSTTKVMQDELCSLIGGHIYQINASGWDRPQYMWCLWSTDCLLPFFEVFIPLLVVKNSIAIVVERFCKRRAIGVTDKKLNQADLKAARLLNKKGPRSP